MHRIGRILFCLLFFWIFATSAQAAENKSNIAAITLKTLLNAPAERVDYSTAKLVIDRLVDPSINMEAALAQVDQMAAKVRRMLVSIPPKEAKKSIERMRALQAFIYRAGHWNGNRPFKYDHDDPYGKDLSTKLLPTYLATRKGNCISMPILFLVLGERLGLKLPLSTAPLHVLVKYTDDQTGQTYNLEATSGAGFTRDSHYQKSMPMTVKALENGVYLKNLSRKETLAVMATLVVEHLIEQRRYQEAIDVADVLLEAYPAHAFLLAKKGTAYYHLLHSEIISRYSNLNSLPTQARLRANSLYRQNQLAFQQAEALGWQQRPAPVQ